MRPGGDEHPVDGIATGWDGAVSSACSRGEDAQPFFDDGLEVGQVPGFGVFYGGGDFVGCDGGVDFGLQGGVGVGVGEEGEEDDADGCGRGVAAGEDLEERFASGFSLGEAVADEGAEHVRGGGGGGVVAGGDDGVCYARWDSYKNTEASWKTCQR